MSDLQCPDMSQERDRHHDIHLLPESEIYALVIALTGGMALACYEIGRTIDDKHHKVKVDCGQQSCPTSSKYQSASPKKDLPLRPPDDKPRK
jgi:hypothetical protein